MGVYIHGRCNAGMAEAFRYDFRIDALFQKYRCVGVPQAVDGEFWQPGCGYHLLIAVANT